ncbi:hypothetical protein EVAR_79701_1 [Eumeta japonica]|uniref:Uncharacterized protein n=1 Tax=Eumeta variegata TaxID=151549 RepID=A0A4C1T931_EUMVA|nr:hypothetical protein EVAR_79701_1 [Eumeta japonica]
MASRRSTKSSSRIILNDSNCNKSELEPDYARVGHKIAMYFLAASGRAPAPEPVFRRARECCRRLIFVFFLSSNGLRATAFDYSVRRDTT